MKQYIKKKLMFLFKQSGLKVNLKTIGIITLPFKEVIHLTYILSPFFKKYGKNPKQRLKNIEKFIHSKDFKNEIHKKPYMGGACDYSEFKIIKKKFPKIYNRIPKRKYIAYSTKNEEVLLHEAIHALLLFNKIILKNFFSNEGLVKYLEYKALGKIDSLSKEMKKIKRNQKPIFKKALFFAKELENKNPEERRNFLRKIKN